MQWRKTAPRVPPGSVVYAVGDIHGRFDLLKQIVTRIETDAAPRTAGRRCLVFLGDYLFVHAGIRPGIAVENQSKRDQLWIRTSFHVSESDHGAVIVHGHDIVPNAVFRENRIGIDTGASSSGVLTCLVLENERQRILQTSIGHNS